MTDAELPDEVFAFPAKRKEPLTDAQHVRNALARIGQVENATDGERDLAFTNILAAAKHYHVDIDEDDWREVGHGSRERDRAPGVGGTVQG
jgi:hypothetical protein